MGRRFSRGLVAPRVQAPPELGAEAPVDLVQDLVELASRVDVLSIHVPLSPETHHLVDAEVLDALSIPATLQDSLMSRLDRMENAKTIAQLGSVIGRSFTSAMIQAVAQEDMDVERYQTLFAEITGAVAAPTAGLHFSKNLLKRMEVKGINFTSVTLHTGSGTFRTIAVEDLSKHKMDSEELVIDEKATEIVNRAKRNKKRVCAVGTTVMRGLESAVSSEHMLNTFEGWTNKFIFPPYEFSIANAMITNFHLPKSTLLMMVSAFMGHDLMKRAYKEAILEQYRFYSYGDAMLIL